MAAGGGLFVVKMEVAAKRHPLLKERSGGRSPRVFLQPKNQVVSRLDFSCVASFSQEALLTCEPVAPHLAESFSAHRPVIFAAQRALFQHPNGKVSIHVVEPPILKSEGRSPRNHYSSNIGVKGHSRILPQEHLLHILTLATPTKLSILHRYGFQKTLANNLIIFEPIQLCINKQKQ